MGDILNDIADAVAERDRITEDLAAHVGSLLADVVALEDQITDLEQQLAERPTTPPEPSVDLILPPDGKLWIGVSNPANGYNSFKAITNREPRIWHEYSTSGSSFAADLTNCPAQCIPLINCKPVGSMGANAYTSILAGDADTDLDQITIAIKNYDRPVFVAFMHEPENDDKTGASDDNYARAFRYCVEYVRVRGARFVSVWNMMGYMPKWGSRYTALYPGDDVVDWIALDQYTANASHDDFADFMDQGTPGFYDWAAPKGKPIMAAEWGINSTVGTSVAPKLLTQRAVDNLLRDMPQIKALVYWNEAVGGNDYRIESFPVDFRRFANLPVFA